MFNELNANRYCCEDIFLIENYEAALNSDGIYECHHRLEIQDDKVLRASELVDMGLYYSRPANELIFLPISEHRKLHGEGKANSMYGRKQTEETRAILRSKAANRQVTDETRAKISVSQRGKHKSPHPKYKYLDDEGNIHIMDKANAKIHHPDWKLIEE